MGYSYQKTDSHMKRISDWEERNRKCCSAPAVKSRGKIEPGLASVPLNSP